VPQAEHAEAAADLHHLAVARQQRGDRVEFEAADLHVDVLARDAEQRVAHPAADEQGHPSGLGDGLRDLEGGGGAHPGMVAPAAGRPAAGARHPALH
jgi:hypothetical protein